MDYHFNGWQNAAKVKPLQPSAVKTALEFYDLLGTIWSAATCAPRMRADWSPANKTLGQCSITAFLVQDLFGGKVYGIPLPDGNFHCYNVIDGKYFDLTSEQFGAEAASFCYENNPEQQRDVHFAKQEKFERYLLLKQQVLKQLEL